MNEHPLAHKALGRWPEILEAVLGPAFTSGKNRPCPCDGAGRDRFRFSDCHGWGNYFCACSDGSKNGFDLIRCAKKCSFREAAKMVESVIGKADGAVVERAPKIPVWLQDLPRTPSARSAYLERRGLTVPTSLRWVREAPYFEDGVKTGTYAAMLAPVHRLDDFLGFHITYIAKSKKAPVAHPRKLLCSNTAGAACQLYPLEGDELGVGEGIETCIAAHMLFQVPVWAALNTSMLARFEWPAQVKVLRIFADHDANYAGHAAAYALAHRAAMQGVQVAVHLPKDAGDWNDSLLRERQAPDAAEVGT